MCRLEMRKLLDRHLALFEEHWRDTTSPDSRPSIDLCSVARPLSDCRRYSGTVREYSSWCWCKSSPYPAALSSCERCFRANNYQSGWSRTKKEIGAKSVIRRNLLGLHTKDECCSCELWAHRVLAPGREAFVSLAMTRARAISCIYLPAHLRWFALYILQIDNIQCNIHPRWAAMSVKRLTRYSAEAKSKSEEIVWDKVNVQHDAHDDMSSDEEKLTFDTK